MTRKALYATVLARFREAMPVAETELHYTTPFSLLVAVMLSAQCTDKRVNLVTPALLAAYPDAAAMARATADDLLPYIRSVSYPNSKAAHLSGMARMLVDEYGGEIPDTLEALTRLPGVGRKTANVILSVLWNRPTMPVDTHVFRVSHRIGLVSASATTPLRVEQELMRHIPEADIPAAHHWLILHGRYVCKARNPHCADCFLADVCKGKKGDAPHRCATK
jgi:endonuclease-3